MSTQNRDFLYELDAIVKSRLTDGGSNSYTARLASEGIARVAQKVGEEGVEVALASVTDSTGEEFKSEAADLIYHLLVLLNVRDVSLAEITAILASRHST